MGILKAIWNKIKPGPREVSTEEMAEKINNLQKRCGFTEEQMPEIFQNFGNESCANCRFDDTDKGNCRLFSNRVEALAHKAKKGMKGKCKMWASVHGTEAVQMNDGGYGVKICECCGGDVLYFNTKVASLCTNPECSVYLKSLFTLNKKDEQGRYLYGVKR